MAASTPAPDATSGGDVLFPFSRILVPWLRDVPQPSAFRLEFDRFADHTTLVANFRFPRYIPHGLFETLTVRAQQEKLSLTTMFHWRGGLYSRHQEHPVRLYLLRIDHEADGSTCVRVETRHEQATKEDADVETLWSVLLPVLRETDNLISKLSGVRVERHMECPRCHALTFLGEWQTPKELQGASSRVCETCKADVSAVYLIQPKEKKRVEEFLRKRILEQQQRRLSEIALTEATSAGSELNRKLEEIREEKAAEAEGENVKEKDNIQNRTKTTSGSDTQSVKSDDSSSNGQNGIKRKKSKQLNKNGKGDLKQPPGTNGKHSPVTHVKDSKAAKPKEQGSCC